MGPRPRRKHAVHRDGRHAPDLEDRSGAPARSTLHAGTGQESAVDGPNRKATFSQPSGFATDGKMIYVADSESSTIRAVEVADNGKTTSVAGSNNLFGFGLVNAKGKEARFQHPLGVALAGDEAAFRRRHVQQHHPPHRPEDAAKSPPGSAPAKADPGTETADGIGFYEPGGISFAGGKLYVADTNHHRIVAVDVKTKAPQGPENRAAQAIKCPPAAESVPDSCRYCLNGAQNLVPIGRRTVHRAWLREACRGIQAGTTRWQSRHSCGTSLAEQRYSKEEPRDVDEADRSHQGSFQRPDFPGAARPTG